MKLSIEKDLKVAVEVDGKIFINSEEGILYQSINDNEILLFIKDEKENKEIKVKINQNDKN